MRASLISDLTCAATQPSPQVSYKMTSCASSAIKRAFDAAMATAGFLVLFPFLGILALAIRIDSPGPVFYRGTRVGRWGKPFRIFKFRTMVENAERIGPSSTPEDDPRVTRVGRLLRKYKLDELPQLLNVIRGEMSLVGPRPQVSWAVELYTPDERAVLSVRPGITDSASLRFRDEGEILRGSPNPDQEYFEKIHPEKMRLSLEYIQTQSLWLDCQILVKTMCVLVSRPPQGSSGSKTDGEPVRGTVSQ
jgi:lipopolysaccharide/colanic/teichoic acid biosynthesis glycosyltransferase